MSRLLTPQKKTRQTDRLTYWRAHKALFARPRKRTLKMLRRASEKKIFSMIFVTVTCIKLESAWIWRSSRMSQRICHLQGDDHSDIVDSNLFWKVCQYVLRYTLHFFILVTVRTLNLTYTLHKLRFLSYSLLKAFNNSIPSLSLSFRKISLLEFKAQRGWWIFVVECKYIMNQVTLIAQLCYLLTYH